VRQTVTICSRLRARHEPRLAFVFQARALGRMREAARQPRAGRLEAGQLRPRVSLSAVGQEAGITGRGVQEPDLIDNPRPPMRSALTWGALNFLVTQLGAFLVFLVLARTLDQAVFGVFAFAVVLLDLMAVQGKYALVDALVIGRDFSRRRLSTAFWLAIAVCAAAALLTWVVAAPLAARMNMPALALILPLLGALLILTPAQAVMEAELAFKLQVRSIAARNMATTVVGGVIGVVVALGPAPEWALVAQRAAQALSATLFLWPPTRFWPQATFDHAAARDLMFRGGAIWRNFVAAIMPKVLIQVSVGAALGAAALGVMRVLERLIEIVQQPFLTPFTNLVVPVLSRWSEGRAERSDQALDLIRGACALCAPAFAGLALVAPDLTRVILDERYTPYASVLTALAIGGLFAPLLILRIPILGALGRNGLLSAQLALDLALAGAAVWLASPYGLIVVAFAMAAVTPISAAAAFLSVRLALGASGRRMIEVMAPAYLGAGVMAGVVLALAAAVAALGGAAWPALARLALYAAAGAIAYACYIWTFHRPWLDAVLRAFKTRSESPSVEEPPSA
jgi:O-antigen/teichoic acid export membrane protein